MTTTKTSKKTARPVLAELSADGDRVEVRFDYSPERVKQIKRNGLNARPVYKNNKFICWRLPLDLPTMRRLREVFGKELGLGDALKAWGHEQVAQEKKLTDLSQANDAELDRINEEFGSWLRPYQRADIKFMSTTNALNTNQPRTGKTPSLIGAVIEAELEWGQHLIFAPKSSLRNVWEDGIKEAYERNGLEEPVVLTGDTPKARREAIKLAAELAEDGIAFWLVLNPAMARLKAVRMLDGKPLARGEFKELSPRDQERTVTEEVLAEPGLVDVEWDTMTIDEFHLMGLSNPTTLGARGVNQIAEVTQPARRYALSGTPMGGKPIKLWGALHFLEPDKFTSRWNWARHWLVINHNGYGSSIEGIMPGREVDFYNHLKPYLVRRTQKEALPGLPEVNRVNVWCDMTPKQAEQYKTFATEAEWAMEGAEEEGRLTAANVLAMYTRLKQFANAYCNVTRTGKETREGLPELKVEATDDSGKIEQLLQKLAEENVLVGKGEDEEEPKAALVFTQFAPMVETVAEVLREKGVPTETITGSTSGKRRNEIVKSFQAGGPDAPRVIVITTTAGGTALTLDRAESVHILDETWVPDDQEQAENRVTPTTAEKMEARISTGAYYYRTRGSVEEYIQRLVAEKALNNKTILDLRRRMQADLAEAEAALDDGEGEDEASGVE